VRRLGRQHHVRQHLAATPAQYQARRLRDPTGGSLVGDGRRSGRRFFDGGAAFRRPEAPSTSELPKAPERPVSRGIPVDTLAARIDHFLSSRGYRPPQPSTLTSQPTPAIELDKDVIDVICEDDVRSAMRAGRKLVVGEKTIITPSARELGEANRIFVQAGLRS
jgi:hypothetical protein